MTEDELCLVEKLGECATEYGRLARGERKGMVDADLAEFASRVHDLQARVMWLGARREHPDRLR